MRVLRKIIGVTAIALYVLVVLVLTVNTWGEYASGSRSLPHAISQTVILLGLPLFVVVAFVLPEGLFHLVAWVIRKLFGKDTGAAQ
jgi:hypothetical protein